MGFRGSYYRIREGDTLEITLRDSTRKKIFEAKCNIRDERALEDIFKIIKNKTSMNVDLVLNKKASKDEPIEEEESWFRDI